MACRFRKGDARMARPGFITTRSSLRQGPWARRRMSSMESGNLHVGELEHLGHLLGVGAGGFDVAETVIEAPSEKRRACRAFNPSISGNASASFSPGGNAPESMVDSCGSLTAVGPFIIRGCVAAGQPGTRRRSGPESDPEVPGVPEGVLVSGRLRGMASCGDAQTRQRSSVEMEALRGDQRRMEARGGGIRDFREEVRIIRLPDRSPRGEGLP